MKIAVVGDMHLGIRSGDQNFLDFQFHWLETVLLPYCLKNKITKIIQTGDMFDVRQYIKLNVLHKVIHDFPLLLKKYKIEEWTTFCGNHDLYYRDDNSISSLDILNLLGDDNLKFVVIKDKVETIMMGGKRFSFVPWINKNNKEELLSQIDKIKDGYLFGHFDMVGMPMYKNILSDHGLDPNVFERFDSVVSGHYHTVSSHKNVQYVGTPYHLTWMDYPDGVNRGFWVLDTDDGSFELIKNPDYMSMFSIIEYDPNETYTDKSFDAYEGNIVKVLINESESEKHLKNFTNLISNASFLDYTIINTTKVSTEKVTVSEAALKLSTSAAIIDYIDKQDVESVNKDNVKKLAQEIYIEAFNK